MKAIFWKELRDYFSSWRFVIIVALICIAAGAAVYTAGETVRTDVSRNPTESVFIRIFTTRGDSLPSFLFFISFFGPFIGIIFGFDAINGERNKGTLSRILSQPVFRDSVINGKFLAGFVTVSIIMAAIMLVVCALALTAVGIPPSSSEVARIIGFYVLSVVYIGFWLGLGILCSVFFRHTVTSAVVPFAIWIFFAIFMSMIAGVIADWREPIDQYSDIEAVARHDSLEDNVSLVSPVVLYGEASDVLLNPERRTLHGLAQTAVLSKSSLPDALSSVSFRHSLTIIWPHLLVILGLTVVCFEIAYIRFLKEEIRST